MNLRTKIDGAIVYHYSCDSIEESRKATDTIISIIGNCKECTHQIYCQIKNTCVVEGLKIDIRYCSAFERKKK